MRLVTVAFVMMLTACGSQRGPLSSTTGSDYSSQRFPDHPDSGLTPGSVCEHPSQIRYPERINYCKRNVATSLKYEIIRQYDREFGYTIGQMNRQDFKIDHYIPICMGGSNKSNNLWPQHKSVYKLTDSLEEMLCRLMAQGRLKQADAIETLKHVKNNLDEAIDLQKELKRKLAR